MYKQHTCYYENSPRKNWPTKQKDMDIALQALFDIMRSSIHKYADYDTDKEVARELIAKWVEKLFEVMPEHYESREVQHQILFNILLTLVEIYPQDGLPRTALNELIANEKRRLLEKQHHSQINTRMVIDKNNWVVTYISIEENKNTDIIIEGVDDNNHYFVKVAHIARHFEGKLAEDIIEFGCVHSPSDKADTAFCGIESFKNIEFQHLKYSEKNKADKKIWCCPKDVVIDLMKMITYGEKNR